MRHDTSKCSKCLAVPSSRDGGWCDSPAHPSYMAEGKCGHLYDFTKDGAPEFVVSSKVSA